MKYKFTSIILILISFVLCGCFTMKDVGISRQYKVPSTGEIIDINADADGSRIPTRSRVYINGEIVSVYEYAPFVGSKGEDSFLYNGLNIRCVYKMTKQSGASIVQVFVFIDNDLAADFYF